MVLILDWNNFGGEAKETTSYLIHHPLTSGNLWAAPWETWTRSRTLIQHWDWRRWVLDGCGQKRHWLPDVPKAKGSTDGRESAVKPIPSHPIPDVSDGWDLHKHHKIHEHYYMNKYKTQSHNVSFPYIFIGCTVEELRRGCHFWEHCPENTNPREACCMKRRQEHCFPSSVGIGHEQYIWREKTFESKMFIIGCVCVCGGSSEMPKKLAGFVVMAETVLPKHDRARNTKMKRFLSCVHYVQNCADAMNYFFLSFFLFQIRWFEFLDYLYLKFGINSS